MSRPPHVQLRPLIVPGPIWRRHRHFLVHDHPFEPGSAIAVLDGTTGRTYVWDNWPPGSATIGVPTTWAFLHHRWTDHVFYLVEAPQRTTPGDATPPVGAVGIMRRALRWLRSRVV